MDDRLVGLTNAIHRRPVRDGIQKRYTKHFLETTNRKISRMAGGFLNHSSSDTFLSGLIAFSFYERKKSTRTNAHSECEAENNRTVPANFFILFLVA